MLVVARAGTVPDVPPPTQDTFHVTVTPTVTAPAVVNVCPQVGEGARGSVPVLHAVPGPVHDMLAPSLVRNVKPTATAVAVTDNPGTDAVAEREPHEPGSSHTHIGRFTNCGAGAGGFNRITGTGSRNARTA